MEELTMCRVCLAEDVRLLLITNTHLHDMYESLTLLPLETRDSRPIRVCYICCAGLQNCYRLRKRCLWSEELLTRVFSSDGLQPLKERKQRQRLRVQHPVLHLSIGDVVQNNTDDTRKDSGDRTDAPNLDDHVKTEQEDAEDIKMEPLEEHDPQIDDDIQCSHIEDSLDEMERESDDLESDTKDIKLEIEDFTIEENCGGSDEAGQSSQSADMWPALEPMAPKDTSVGMPENNKCLLGTQKVSIKNSSNKLKNKQREASIAEPANTSVQCHTRTRATKKQFQCNVCNKSYIRKFNLTRHKYTHTGEKQFQCDVCNKSFWGKCNLIPHMYTHTGERPFQCDLCGKYFRLKCNLTQHMYTHADNKRFQCDVCNKSFNSQHYLKQHTNTHTEKKLLQCSVCNKMLNKVSLKRHMRIHTGEKPFICDICKKCFRDNCTLKIHVRIHTGEKPFTCEICEKCFRHRRTLRGHILTHTGKKPFMCDVCTKCFIHRSALKLHMRTHLTKNVSAKTKS